MVVHLFFCCGRSSDAAKILVLGDKMAICVCFFSGLSFATPWQNFAYVMAKLCHRLGKTLSTAWQNFATGMAKCGKALLCPFYRITFVIQHFPVVALLGQAEQAFVLEARLL